MSGGVKICGSTNHPAPYWGIRDEPAGRAPNVGDPSRSQSSPPLHRFHVVSRFRERKNPPMKAPRKGLCLGSLPMAAKTHGLWFPPHNGFAQKWNPKVVVQKVKSWEWEPMRFWGYAMFWTNPNREYPNHRFHWPRHGPSRVELRGSPIFQQGYTTCHFYNPYDKGSAPTIQGLIISFLKQPHWGIKIPFQSWLSTFPYVYIYIYTYIYSPTNVIIIKDH
jgi:hypothetical protein